MLLFCAGGLGYGRGYVDLSHDTSNAIAAMYCVEFACCGLRMVMVRLCTVLLYSLGDQLVVDFAIPVYYVGNLRLAGKQSSFSVVD